jgi:hypothetical protein
MPRARRSIRSGVQSLRSVVVVGMWVMVRCRSRVATVAAPDQQGMGHGGSGGMAGLLVVLGAGLGSAFQRMEGGWNVLWKAESLSGTEKLPTFQPSSNYRPP